MKKNITFIANWKMYLNFDDSLTLATKNLESLTALSHLPNTNIILCPSAPTIHPLSQIFKTTPIQWGAQDCSEHLIGAFTGHLSAETLKGAGCSACVIGHSERRKFNGETNQMVAQKLSALLEFDVIPIICVGEELADTAAGKTTNVLEEQLTPLCTVLKKYTHKFSRLPIYIAYEPIWSIGSDKTPNKTHLETTLSWINTFMIKNIPTLTLKLIYGGSISSKNINSFKNISFLNGFLIGRASIDIQEFEKIVKSIILGE